MDQKYLRALVKEFYTTPEEQDKALNVLKDYQLEAHSVSKLRESLQVRQRLLDPREPFFDEAQLRAAVGDPSRSSVSGLDNKSHSGGRDPLLQRVATKIALEGFVESNKYEGNED